MTEYKKQGQQREKGRIIIKRRPRPEPVQEEDNEIEPVELREGERVDLIIGEVTPMGYKAIVNSKYLGMLYKNEIFQPLKLGQQVKGYIKKIREDGKIDLSLQKKNVDDIDGLSEKILKMLKENSGSLEFSDRTSPEKIYSMFGVSKKIYKNAIGSLYKRRLITIDEYSISLIKDRDQGASKREGKRGMAEKPVKRYRIVENKKGDRR
ncbi:MAG: RNA-binding protein [Deltaproteobacteria bacterium]|nr:RNA-binding protein [Deltaproteobacteria bacterium]